MTAILKNPFRGKGLPPAAGEAQIMPSTDAARVAALLARCPRAAETPLSSRPDLAARAGVAEFFVKDERGRMGLGSFKALGAAYAIALDAVAASDAPDATTLRDNTYVAASAGNHGLSVAAGARVFGATAVIYLAEGVPEAFAERLRAKGARVVREGATYEASMSAAEREAADNGWTLLSDSSWPGYTEMPRRVMEGYLAMSAEIVASMAEPPTHVFLQAGVGGLAAAVAAHLRAAWGDAPTIVVVEPEAAPALIESIRAGRIVTADGPVSAMGRLDCKEPSMIALAGLARDADFFVTITEQQAADAVAVLSGAGLATTPSGGAGTAPLLAPGPETRELGLVASSRVLVILSEGAEAP